MNSTAPKVSVITVCRNVLQDLQVTIESVLAQQYANLEYIVIDGNSNDGSQQLIESYSHRIAHWASEPDNGIYDAMNKGVQASTGEWVIFMNAGDSFAHPHVLTQIFSQEAGRHSDVIYGDVVKEINGEEVIKKAHRFKNSHRMCFCHQSALARRALLLQYPFDTSHKLSADFKFFKQVGLAGFRFHYAGMPVAIFDTHGVSNTSRSMGLLDNIKVIKETDSWLNRCKLLPRLYFVYGLCRLRKK